MTSNGITSAPIFLANVNTGNVDRHSGKVSLSRIARILGCSLVLDSTGAFRMFDRETARLEYVGEYDYAAA